VGSRVVGEYRPGAGPMDLVSDVWTALAAGEPAACVLVTSPYLVIQLVRLARLAWPRRPVCGKAPSRGPARGRRARRCELCRPPPSLRAAPCPGPHARK